MGANATVSGNTILNTQMNVVAGAGGSFKIIIRPDQKVLCDVDNAESVIKHSITDLKKLVECGSKSELLKTEELRLGDKKFNAYKDFLETIHNNEIDMEISTRISEKIDIPLIRLKSKDAKIIYNVLIKEEKPPNDTVKISGVIKAVDLTTSPHIFKIVTKIDKKEKPITVKFDDSFDNLILDQMKKLSNVNLEKSINKKGINERESITYKFKNFIN